MEQQNNFSFLEDPMIWEDSLKEDWLGNANFQFQQAQPGSSDMSRDFSSQSNNTTNSSNSFLTNATTCSAASTSSTQDWNDHTDSYLIPRIKIEKGMYPYTSSTEYSTEHQFGDGRPSPTTEQLNALEDMTLYQQPHAFHNPSDFQQGSVSSNPRHYSRSFRELSSTPEKADSYSMDNYQTQGSQSTSHGSTLSAYQQPYLPSNSHNGYTSAQSGEKPTPSSLGWVSNTDLVKKYKLSKVTKNNLYLDLVNDSDLTPETPFRVYLESVP